jgi:ComF family protein
MEKNRKRFRGLLSKAIEYAFDTVAPPDPFIRRIENMSPAEFVEHTQRIDRAAEIEGITSFFSYKDPLVKAAIIEVKSYGNRKISRLLGSVVWDSLVEDLSELEVFKNFSSPLLIPIPMTKKSKRKRGWNQCKLIAREISAKAGSLSPNLRLDILVKSKETDDQVGKSRSERFTNLKGCFSVACPEALRGRNVIIFDDIATTGATLHEARRTLLKAGAKRAFCIAIAH